MLILILVLSILKKSHQHGKQFFFYNFVLCKSFQNRNQGKVIKIWRHQLVWRQKGMTSYTLSKKGFLHSDVTNDVLSSGYVCSSFQFSYQEVQGLLLSGETLAPGLTRLVLTLCLILNPRKKPNSTPFSFYKKISFYN